MGNFAPLAANHALFEHAAGIQVIHAPYKSGCAAATDVLGGQVQMMFEHMSVAMPGVQSGKTRAIAITSKMRNALLPDLPTMSESGCAAVEVLNCQGLVGPKGLPPDIVKLLNAVAKKALQDKEVKEEFSVNATNGRPSGCGGELAAVFLRS